MFLRNFYPYYLKNKKLIEMDFFPLNQLHSLNYTLNVSPIQQTHNHPPPHQKLLPSPPKKIIILQTFLGVIIS